MFREEAAQMGLTVRGNTYSYSDEYSSVKYMDTQTIDEQLSIPLLAIFTSPPRGQEFGYAGYVSQVYMFIGNAVAMSRVREAISTVGTPIFNEFNLMNVPKYTQMFAEIIISRENTLPEVGMVYPQVSIYNSYDGHRGIEISFGLAFYGQSGRNQQEFANMNRHSFSFREKLGTFKQIHSQRSRTVLSTAIGSYISAIGDNILGLFQENYNTVIDEQTLLSTLDLIESIGKRRRIDISDYLHQLNVDRGSTRLSTWDLFVAITKFSTVEKNINAKKLLEDAAERVLVVPSQMIDALKVINR